MDDKLKEGNGDFFDIFIYNMSYMFTMMTK